jgi:hypothetical protein
LFYLGKAGCFNEMEEIDFDEFLKSHDDDNSTQKLEQLHKKGLSCHGS